MKRQQSQRRSGRGWVAVALVKASLVISALWVIALVTGLLYAAHALIGPLL